ncbi:MAG: hypothetical protein ACMG6E_01690, partial [Candidatus Roizmanbacteria bacterium]
PRSQSRRRGNSQTLLHKILTTIKAEVAINVNVSSKFDISLPSRDYLIFLAPFSKLFDLYRLLKHLKVCRILDTESQMKLVAGNDTLILLNLVTTPL